MCRKGVLGEKLTLIRHSLKDTLDSGCSWERQLCWNAAMRKTHGKEVVSLSSLLPNPENANTAISRIRLFVDPRDLKAA